MLQRFLFTKFEKGLKGLKNILNLFKPFGPLGLSKINFSRACWPELTEPIYLMEITLISDDWHVEYNTKVWTGFGKLKIMWTAGERELIANGDCFPGDWPECMGSLISIGPLKKKRPKFYLSKHLYSTLHNLCCTWTHLVSTWCWVVCEKMMILS